MSDDAVTPFSRTSAEMRTLGLQPPPYHATTNSCSSCRPCWASQREKPQLSQQPGALEQEGRGRGSWTRLRFSSAWIRLQKGFDLTTLPIWEAGQKRPADTKSEKL